jgi:hypothetical protein
MENNKHGFLGKLLASKAAPLLTGLGTAGVLDNISNHGDYSNFSSTPRLLNFGLNTLFGGGAGVAFQKGNPLLGVSLIGAAPAKDVMLAGAGAIPKALDIYKDSQKNVFDRFNELSPTQKTLAVAATGLTAAVAVPALMNLSAAAKRLADGRAVRLSTSIRKRRNQDKDLVIGVQPIPGEGEEIQSEQIAQPEESKGFLSKIFG